MDHPGATPPSGQQPDAFPAAAPESAPPEAAPAACPRCGSGDGAPPAWVYALGRIEPRFPSLGVEKEFAQATARADTSEMTDQQTFHHVLSRRGSRYLARQLCWVLSVEGLETYLLQPRDPADLDLLVEAIRPQPGPLDLDLVIGLAGPLAPPQLCNGLSVPIVSFDQIYSFDAHSLIQAIPRPEQMSAEQFEPAAREVLDRVLHMTDNAGATDEHRALNYLAVRYPALYATAAERYAGNYALRAVQVRPSPLSGVRNVVEVIFSFTHRQHDVTEKHFVRVDVTEEFPFLVTRMSPYYDR